VLNLQLGRCILAQPVWFLCLLMQFSHLVSTAGDSQRGSLCGRVCIPQGGEKVSRPEDVYWSLDTLAKSQYPTGAAGDREALCVVEPVFHRVVRRCQGQRTSIHTCSTSQFANSSASFFSPAGDVRRGSVVV